jgi:flagellar protein FlbD
LLVSSAKKWSFADRNARQFYDGIFTRDETYMIRLTRLSNVPLVVNSDLIEHIEVTSDTIISMTTGQRITVLEGADEVIARVVQFRRTLLQNPAVRASGDSKSAS